MYKERFGVSKPSLKCAEQRLTASTSVHPPCPINDQDTSCSSDLQTVEEARKLTKELRQKTRSQAQQILALRRAYKIQEMTISRLQRENSDQLKLLSSKLLLFESRLLRKQKDISAMMAAKESIIQRQQTVIETLTTRLMDHGVRVPQTDLEVLTTTSSSGPDLDSLNDSDSAVVLEDIDSDCMSTLPKYRSIGRSDGVVVTVVRSISDAIEPHVKYTSPARRHNCFLRRPDILETVYSVEEDGDCDPDPGGTVATSAIADANRRRDAFAMHGKVAATHILTDNNHLVVDFDENCKTHSTNNYNCNTIVCDEGVETGDEIQRTAVGNPVKTYNRVMSNHRSVTKPKDVKYKRINKAKSKSLEELRGRLRNWVEQGSRLAGITLEHSQSYA